MDRAALTAHCLALPGAVALHPFGPGALVCKVGGKIFAIIAEGADPPEVSLKCDPALAEALRAAHAAVLPGYHLNKRHWNTVTLDGSIDDDEVRAWVEDSYDLVVAGLPKRQRDALAGASEGGRR